MISIIVCSIDNYWFTNFSASVEKTIGVNYEIIQIDNKIENLSITKAYNKGAKKAKYEYLVFVHEDIIFQTPNWGNLLLHYFYSLENPGVLGVVGSSYLPISPSDWWISDMNYIHTNYLSNSKEELSGQGVLKCHGEQIPKKVYAVDGMFLTLKKSVFLEISFDERLLGFHGYDTDLSYQVSRKYQNYFIPGILMEHFSKGQPNTVWLENTEIAKRKILPQIHDLVFRKKVLMSLECKAYHLFLGQLLKYGKNRIYNINMAYFYFKEVNRQEFRWKLIPLVLKYILAFVFKRYNYSNFSLK